MVSVGAVAALAVELRLPAALESEQPWMQVLRLALPRLLPVKLFRQVPGRHKVERGGVMQGAPVGAADLTGYVVGPGRRIELEVKHSAGKHSAGKLRPEQRRWLDACAADGVIALVVDYDATRDATWNLRTAACDLARRIAGVAQ